ncbi:MAG: hypothetical protein QXE31_02670 [Candidatus Woesearchaeota archaeon]
MPEEKAFDQSASLNTLNKKDKPIDIKFENKKVDANPKNDNNKNNLSLDLPEPPKFNLDDLPEPPKLDIDEFKPTLENKKDVNFNDQKNNLKLDDLPEMPKIDIKPIQPSEETKKEKKGLFSFLFKKKKEEKVELFPKIEPPKVEMPQPEQSDKKITDLSELEFAPPSLKPILNENLPNQTLEKNSIDNLKLENNQLENIKVNSDTSKTDINQKIDINQDINVKQDENEQLNKKAQLSDLSVEPLNKEIQKINLSEKIDNKYSLDTSFETVNKETIDESDKDLTKNEKTMLQEGEAYLKSNLEEKVQDEISSEKEQEVKEIPISEVKGIGPKREQKLKKLGIKTAQKIAELSFKDLAKKLKIPDKEAKKIITNARKITRIKKKLKQTKVQEGITDVVKKLEKERKKIEVMQKVSKINENKLIEIEGHAELVKILEALEKKRLELERQEQLLRERELKLSSHDETYKREVEQIENLRRKLDQDIRERTEYLINLEKDYFQRGQILAKKQAEIEIKEKELDEKYKLLKEQEEKLKIKANELEDRAITLNAKEKNYEKIVKELEKQDLVLKEKEEDLLKREAEYMKRLDLLESHEKEILKNLEEKRKKLEQKEKEIELKEQQLKKKEKLVDKKSVALEYEKDIIETQKDKLVDDEFEQYLHEQLGLVRNSGINIDDINFVKNIKEPTFENTAGKIHVLYQMIDTCRDLLKNNKITDAKIFYNQIRDKYYETTFNNPKEKENIHNMLRTLYDEINLADIK